MLSIKNKPSFFDHDDLFQTGFMGLMKAIKNYNEKLGPFIPYAKKIIMFEIKEDFRKNAPMKRHQKLNQKEKQKELVKLLLDNSCGFPSTIGLIDILLEHDKEKRSEKMCNKTLKEIKRVIKNRRKRIERTLK